MPSPGADDSGRSGGAGGAAAGRGAWRVPLYLVYATAFLPLFYLPDSFYPFITGRAAALRVLVAAALAAAAWLAVRGAGGRSVELDGGEPVLLALAAYVGVLLAASLLGPSPRRSLFGNLERMTGWIGWLFWGGFYLSLRLVLGGRQWRRYLRLTLAATAAVAALGLVQAYEIPVPVLEDYLVGLSAPGEKPVSTLGNSGYLAVYMMLGLGVAALVWIRSRSRGWRRAALLCGALDAWALWLAESQSVLLGLAAGAAVGAAAWGATRLPRRLRLTAAAAAALAVTLAGGWVLSEAPRGRQAPDSPLSIPGMASDEVRERRLAWEAAMEGVGEHPAAGAGAENFMLVFDRNFDSWIHRYDRSEVYMDRAHNAFLHAFSEAGIPGGTAYLAVWFGLAWLLWRGYATGRVSAGEVGVLSGIFASYGVFLFFWFEDPNSFPLFLALAAYAAHRVRAGPPRGERPRPERQGEAGGPGAWGVALFATAAAAATAWHHARVMDVAGDFHDARRETAVAARATGYLSVVEGRPPGTQDVLTETASFLAGLRGGREQIADRPEAARAVQAAMQGTMDRLGEEVRRDPRNARLRAVQSSLYETAYEFSGQEELHRRAVRALERAIELAPNRLRYRRVLAEMHLGAGEPGAAREPLEEALRLDPKSARTQKLISRALLALGEPVPAYGRLRLAHRMGLEPPEGLETAARLAEHLREMGRPEDVRWLVETYGLTPPGAGGGSGGEGTPR